METRIKYTTSANRDVTTAAEIEAHGLVLARSNVRPDTQELATFTEHDSADYVLELAERIRAERAAAGTVGKLGEADPNLAIFWKRYTERPHWRKASGRERTAARKAVHAAWLTAKGELPLPEPVERGA